MPSYEDFIKEQAAQIKVDGAKFVEKYKPLVEDIQDEYLRTSTAILLENEAQYGDKLLKESTTAGSSIGTAGQFIRYALPIIRRVFPNLIANKLVGVQPLMQAVGYIFYLRYKIEQGNRGQTLANTQLNLKLNNTSTAAGNDLLDPINVSTPYRNFPVNPYYTKQIINNQRALQILGADAGNFITKIDIGAGANWQSNVTFPLQTTAPSATTPWTIKVLEADETKASFNQIKSQYSWNGAVFTTITQEAQIGGLDPIILTAAAYAGGNFTITGTSNAGTTATKRVVVFDFQMNLEANADISELKITIDKDTVEAKTRKLKTVWTPESAQDFKSYHGIDVEAELTALMSQEIALEIDREIIADLLNLGAQISHNFDQGAATNYNYLDRHVALMQRILLESNNIMRDTLRGKANWIVTSPEIASVLEVLKEFKPYGGTAFQGLNAQTIGFRGNLMGSMEVYVDPLFPKQKILLGYKGPSVVDSGYYYAPYIPLELTPVIYDPYDFTPRRGALTRYATKTIERGTFYYRTITVQNSSTDTDFNPVS